MSLFKRRSPVRNSLLLFSAGALVSTNACSTSTPAPAPTPHVATTAAALTQCTLDTPVGSPAMTSSPALVARRTGVLDLVYAGANRSVRHRSLAAGQTTWSAEEDWGGIIVGKPGPVAWGFLAGGEDRLDVMARSSDNALARWKWTPTTAPSWDWLGSQVLSGVATASWGVGRLDAFYLGDGAYLRHRAFSGNAWSAGDTIEASLVGDPAAISPSDQVIHVFARNQDNQLWHRAYDHGWKAPELLGGDLHSSPTVASWGPGHLDVLWRGADDTLKHKAFDAGQWGPEDDLGGSTFKGDPTAASWGAKRLDVVVQDAASGALVRRSWFGANAALTPADCTAAPSVKPLTGTYRGYMTLLGSGLPAAGPDIALPDTRIPITAIAADGSGAPAGQASGLQGQTWAMIQDPLRAASSSGNVLVTAAPSFQSYAEQYVAPGAHTDGLGNTGSLQSRIYTDADGAPRLTSGKLTGYFYVDVPVLTVQVGFWPLVDQPTMATQKWAFVLENTGDLKSTHACGSCGTNETCDTRVGVCLAGPTAVSSTDQPIGTVHHTLAATWPGYIDQAVDTASKGAGDPWQFHATPALMDNPDTNPNLIPNFYTPLPDVTSSPIGGTTSMIPYAHVIDRDRIYNVQTSLAYNLCERDFKQGDVATTVPGYWGPALVTKQSSYIGGCQPKTPLTFLNTGDICNVVYDSTWMTGSSGTTCNFASDPHIFRKTWENGYLPCYDGNPNTPGTNGGHNYNCSNLYKTSNLWNQQTTSYNDWLAGSCNETNVDARWATLSGFGPYTYRKIFLCPIMGGLTGKSDRPGYLTSGTNDERLGCYDPAAQTGSQKLASNEILRWASGDVQTLSASKEAACVHSDSSLYPPYTFPLITYRDNTSDPDIVNMPGMLTECENDLSLPFSTNIDQALNAHRRCLSPGRFFTSLRDSAQNTRLANFNHLLQQWSEMQSFLALQGAQGDEILTVLSQDLVTQPPAPHAPLALPSPLENLNKLLGRLDDNWDLYFDRDVQTHLIPAANAGDYRRGSANPSAPTDPNVFGSGNQGVSLAILLLESATAYLEAQGQAISKTAELTVGRCALGASIVDQDTARTRAGRTLRYAAALSGLADTIAAGTDGAHLDAARWGRSRRAFGAVRQHVIDEVVDMLACKPPVNAENNDAPIVFNDQQTTISRFFASSDYFRSIAKTEVQHSVDAINAARDAWVNARNSHIQALGTTETMASRLDDLERHYGDQIVEMCGLPDDGKDALTLFDPTKGHLTPQRCYVPPDVHCLSDTDATCYRGTMGEPALAIVAAAEEVKIAQMNMGQAQADYDGQVAYCEQLDQSLLSDEKFTSSHNKVVLDLQDAKYVSDAVATALSAAKDCAKPFETPLSFGAACGIAIAEGVAKEFSLEYQNEIDHENTHYAEEMKAREDHRQVEACLHEADNYKGKIDGAREQIQARLIQAQASMLHLTNAQNAVAQLVMEGRSAVERERGRAVPSVEFHYWLNEKVETFRQQFGWAKHVAFLALKAVEYDYQLDRSDLHDLVLKAQTPAELDSAMKQIDDATISRQINGHQPGEERKVFSLRDDLLSIFTGPGDTDRSAATAALRAKLQSPDSDVVDASGELQGKGIPFTLRKELTATQRCGERLWRVMASYVGDGVSSDARAIGMFLMKNNTFSNRWCGNRGTPNTDQVGLSRPLGYFFGGHGQNPIEIADKFAAASIPTWPFANEFYNDAYSNGASMELAGRGVFGDYVLLIPKSELDPNKAHHVNLGALEDVLIRFDYEDVDDLHLN